MPVCNQPVPLAQRKPPHALYKRLGASRNAPLLQTKPSITASPTHTGDAAGVERMHEDAEDDVMEVEVVTEGRENEDGMEVEVVTRDRECVGATEMNEDDVENRPPQPGDALPPSMVRGWWVGSWFH